MFVKKIRKLLVLFLIVMLIVPNTTSVKTSAATTTLSKTTATLTVGQTLKLKLGSVISSKVTWSSSEISVATIKSGTITAKNKGNTVITAKYNNKKYTCKITVKAKQLSYGTVSGNITYYYNDFKGSVSDTGATVILIPKDKSAYDADITKYSSTETLNKYNIYSAKVDGMGAYTIDHIPVGEYKIYVISNKANSEYWFNAFDDNLSDASDNYYNSIAENFYPTYLSEDTAIKLARFVRMYKYEISNITVYKNENSTFSYDFGMTYI